MPKWDYALNDDDKMLLKRWEDEIMKNAMARAKKLGEWVTVYWDGKDVSYKGGEIVGQASATTGNLNDMRKYYAIKFLC